MQLPYAGFVASEMYAGWYGCDQGVGSALHTAPSCVNSEGEFPVVMLELQVRPYVLHVVAQEAPCCPRK